MKENIDKSRSVGNRFFMDFESEFTSMNGQNILYKDLEVEDANFLNPEVDPTKLKYSKNIFEFGNAITVHLSQGSSWKNVLFFYDPFGDEDLRRKLLYTGITRAEKGLVLGI